MATYESTKRTDEMQEWIVAAVLEATDACMNCGNKTVKTV